MAIHDLMPYTGPLGGHVRIQHFRLNAAESFTTGEPVALNSAGELTESNDNPASTDLVGISAQPADTTDTTLFNPKTGNNYATGDMIAVYMADSTSYFATPNYSTDGSGAALTEPVVANIGLDVGLVLGAGGVWSIDSNAGTTKLCRIIDIVDNLGRSIQDTGTVLASGAVHQVIFAIVMHQMVPNAAVAEAPIA